MTRTRTLRTGWLLTFAFIMATRLMAAEPGWKLILDESFDGPELNPKIWNIETGKRRDAMNSASAVDLKDGKLVITTYTDEKGVTHCGFVTTRQKFLVTQGKAVARCRFSVQPGTQVAFWAQSPTFGASGGDPAKGAEDGVEIDILESTGVMKGGYQYALHWGNYKKTGKSSNRKFPTPVGHEWHEYGVEWDDTGYRFTFDGKLVATDVKCPGSKVPEFLLLTSESIADGRSWSGKRPLQGYSSKEKSTNKLEVDWVKVWERVPDQPLTTSSPGLVGAESEVKVNAQSTEVQFLSGRGKDDAVPWRFFCTSGANSGIWTNLPVPSQWDVKGFGTLNYRNDLTKAWDECGLYEHDFSVPQHWSGKRIFLVFDGVMTDADVKWNGQSVGPVHQGSFYRFKYEVTRLVKFGATNKLEVTVSKHSANKSINDAERLADFWVFGGIYRPVYLEAVPAQFIERVAIDAKADGTFAADIFLNGVTTDSEVEAQIQTLQGNNVGEAFRVSASSGPGRLKAKIDSPKQWTAETPNLYRAEFRLKQNGNVVHRFTQRFGFRTMEVRDGDGLYVNGRRVILKGANRHSFWPESGRCLSEAVHRLDINTMKDANMNAVRMSHYPPDEQFLDLCDELGLYVLDELAGWHRFYDDEVGPKLVREMVARDVNHPCIVFWDNGNEGGFNTNLDHIFLELDPQQRRVLHPWAIFSGVNTSHYLPYDKAETTLRTHAKYIYMPTEFMHGLYDGGAGAGLDDYWHMMMSRPSCTGGFIWALLDEGVKRPDTGEIDVAGNQAPDGIVGPYRQREGSFYTIKEIWSPIQVTRQTNDVFTVENHFSFTDARECKFSWQLRNFAPPSQSGAAFAVAREGTVNSPSIPPGNKGVLKLPAVATDSAADALALRVDDSSGRELWTWVWPLRPTGLNRLTQEPAEHHAVSSEANGVITVTAGELSATFNKGNGMLLGAQRGTQKFSLANGPRLAVGKATLCQIRFGNEGTDAFVSAIYDGDLKSVFWRVKGNGWVNCEYTYTAQGTNDFHGVLFDYPEELVRHKRWLGEGPYRVWKNRLRGVTMGVWANDYNNTITGYRDWVYPEFKGVFANVHWLQLGTAEGAITVLNNGATPFVQVLTPEVPPTNMVGKAAAPLPQCGLGFLDAIPPIGSKFKEARFSGPQGQPNVTQGEFAGAVGFYFGKLSLPATGGESNK